MLNWRKMTARTPSHSLLAQADHACVDVLRPDAADDVGRMFQVTFEAGLREQWKSRCGRTPP